MVVKKEKLSNPISDLISNEQDGEKNKFWREKLIANFLPNLKYKLEKVFLEFFDDGKRLYKKERIVYYTILFY